MARFLAPAFAILVLMGSTVVLSACNTTAGAGQDVSATGHAITRSADDVKAKLP